MESPIAHRRVSRRCVQFGAGFLLIVVAMISLNVAVDPYGIYRNSNREVLSRITLAERLRSQSFDTLLIGTSSPGVFQENSPHLRGSRAIIAALPGASITEFEVVVHHAMQHAGVARIVILIDFVQFNACDARPAEFDRSLFNADLTWWEYHRDKLLGVSTTAASIRRLLWKGEMLPSPDGSALTAFAPTETPRLRFESNARHYLKSPKLLRGYRYSVVQLERFRETVQFAHAHGVELHIAINPSHVMQLETIRAAGLWETFEGWKRDIAGIVAQENLNSGKKTPLWDFTAYASYPAEPIPAADCATPPVYYNEGSNFTPALAEIMLAHMFQDDPRDETFGERIHTYNVQERHARIREEYHRWREQNVAEIAWIEEIAKEYGHTPVRAIVTSRDDRAVRK